MVIDLGGGSLELSDTTMTHFTSLPLGFLSLETMAQNDPRKAHEILHDALVQVPWLDDLPGRSLIAIGAGMRSIARLHMAATHYPLSVMHDYRLPKAEGLDFAHKLLAGPVKGKLHDMSRSYSDVLPYRAAALCTLLNLPQIDEVRFATFGLREGVLFSQVGPCPVLADPLLAFAADHAERNGRGVIYAKALAGWVMPLLPALDERFVRAAAMFTEIGWREQPVYRALSLFNRVLGGSYVGADHNLRARLALAAFFRHEDQLLPGMRAQIKTIVSPTEMAACQALGALFNLAALLDPGALGHLERFRLEHDSRGRYILQMPRAFKVMQSEEVTKRLQIVRRRLHRYEHLNKKV